MNKLNLTFGNYAKVFAENTDESREERKNRKSLSEKKASRIAQK